MTDPSPSPSASRESWENRVRRTGGAEAEALRKRQREAKRRRRARFYSLGLNSQGRPMRNRKAPPRPVYEPPHPDRCPCYDCLWKNRPTTETLPTGYRVNTENGS